MLGRSQKLSFSYFLDEKLDIAKIKFEVKYLLLNLSSNPIRDEIAKDLTLRIS